MKELEDLARLRVEEAIQHGLRAQSIQRALREGRHQPTAAARPAAVRRVKRQGGWFLRLSVRSVQFLKVVISG